MESLPLSNRHWILLRKTISNKKAYSESAWGEILLIPFLFNNICFYLPLALWTTTAIPNWIPIKPPLMKVSRFMILQISNNTLSPFVCVSYPIGNQVDFAGRPHIACNLIKLFLRELNEPLLTFSLHPEWIATSEFFVTLRTLYQYVTSIVSFYSSAHWRSSKEDGSNSWSPSEITRTEYQTVELFATVPQQSIFLFKFQ